MKKALVNLYYRWRYIKQLLTTPAFVVIYYDPKKPYGSRQQLHSNLVDQESISELLQETADTLASGDSATESLFNTLGIKRADE